MKTNIVGVLVCTILFVQAYGQEGEFNCPVTQSWAKARSQNQKGKTTLSKTGTTTDAITGPQDLVVLFVDFRIESNITAKYFTQGVISFVLTQKK